MIGFARWRYLLLALMVAASHVALMSHVAAHFQPALEQCELCVSQAQPLAAIPAAEHASSVEYAPPTSQSPAATLPQLAALVKAHHPRDPPASSS
jgi:hypothetical protein